MATYAEPTYAGDSLGDKKEYDVKSPVHDSHDDEYRIESGAPRALHRDLHNRHVQMIAIGGAIGAGLFVGSGGALSSGGPASLVIGFMIIGIMLLFTIQALAEMAVLFPVNGAFYTFSVRFIDRSWGFAMGWDYAIQWLTILPFEITAASITISFWPRGAEIDGGVWIAVFLVVLIGIQFFGVRGFGEVEFVLSMIKVTALVGFIILAIIIDCGGVPTSPLDPKYIGAKYWYDPGAFRNGFQGFCSVFVTASFAFGGTELTGLAAAETDNPLKAIPKACKQTFWRITIFYVVGLLMVGLIVPSDSTDLLHSSGANTKYSPFVLAIQSAGIQALPSIFNVVITLSVLSVANSSAYASTRTLQALSMNGMGPKWLAYVDKAGRPIYCVLLQIAFGFLAFIAEGGMDTRGKFFNWLLALSGLANFFVWGSICLSHIRFRAGWAAQGRTLDEIPYKAFFGVYGSWAGFALNWICLAAAFYNALFSIGGTPDAYDFFSVYLAAPIILALYLFWKVYSRDWSLFIRARDMDVTTGLREDLEELRQLALEDKEAHTWGNLPKRIIGFLF